MFKRTSILLIVSVLAMSLVGCTAVQAGPQAEAQTPPTPTEPQMERDITVIGVGRVNLVPDVAEIIVGAEFRAGTVSEAKDRVDRQMEAIAVALSEFGIAEKDIQSSQYSIYYEQEPYQSFAREEGAVAEPQGLYRVSSMLEVTVRDVEKAGEVLDAVVAAGANQVWGVTFTVSDDQKWQSQARKEAMADARSRAQELATLAEVELGDVLSVSEVIGGAMVYAERAMGGGGGIAPGELEMTTQIQVTFAIQ